MPTATEIKIKKSKKAKHKKGMKERIPINSETFEILEKFTTGEFPEILGEPEEMDSYTPGDCPKCHSDAGYDRVRLMREGPLHTSRLLADHHQQTRNWMVRCIDCGSEYRLYEVWNVWVQFE